MLFRSQEDIFNGKVTQVRLDPTVTSNVVTYTVIIEADNSKLKLMPGLTATVTIYTLEITDALAIPEGALNYEISPDLLQKYAAQNKQKTSFDSLSKKSDNAKSRKLNRQEKSDYVWVLSNKKLERRLVTKGAGDEINYQILSGLSENDSVVTIVKKISNKEEIAMLMNKEEFNEFCEIWKEVHDNE